MKMNLKSFLLVVFLSASFLLSSCVRRDETFYFGNYSEGEKLFNEKKYDKAIERYQAYLEENPEGNLAIIANYYIGKSHMALGHKEEATKIFEKIVKEHPGLVWANFAETQLKQLNPAYSPAVPEKKKSLEPEISETPKVPDTKETPASAKVSDTKTIPEPAA